MRGLRKSKKVYWASDVNLCQVRLFLSEESPSQVGSGAQDELQAKTLFNPSGSGPDDNLPPGFEGTDPANLLKNKLSQIPLVKWRCPPRFLLDLTWQVVSGGESKEAEVQNQREMRVLEAVYPRPSAIPPNPSLLMGVEDTYPGDQHIPLIPITPIEDEDTAVDTSLNGMVQTNATSSQPQLVAPGPPANINPAARPGMALGVEPNVVTAAYAALSAVMTSNDPGNMIDPDLLVKILSNPNMIEKLVNSHGAAASPQITAKQRPPVTIPDALPVHVNRTESVAPSLAATSSGPFYPPSRMGPVPQLRPPPTEVVSSVGVPVTKDINYYKSLIQQHGGERPEPTLPFSSGRQNHQLGATQELVINPKSRDSKPKSTKPCIYFNSSRGCRHGAKCAYQHDVSSQQHAGGMPEVQSAKRMKMDSEITGT